MSSIINDILSSTVALAIIAFLCKLVLNHLDKRQLESYKSRLKFESDLLTKKMESEFLDKKEKSVELGRWGLTLLSSVNGLLGRIKHIKNANDLLSDEYYKQSTRYYLCQFLCWGQLFRKERNATLISPVSDEILIGELMKNVSVLLRNNDSNFPVLRSLEQRYIGESLIVNKECMSYKEFLDSKVLIDDENLNDFIMEILKGENKDYLELLIQKLTDLQKHFGKLL